MAELEDEPSNSPRPLPELIGGRYRIVSRLGVGGMGVVYKATDIQLKRSVAIKALEERRLAMDAELADLCGTAIWRLHRKIEDARQQGWDLFAEMIREVEREIRRAEAKRARLERRRS